MELPIPKAIAILIDKKRELSIPRAIAIP